MKLLVLGADARELSGILARMREVRRMRATAEWVRSGTLGGTAVVLVANGAGPARAAATVDRAAAEFRPDAIVCTGFCGALEGSLAVASLVTASRVTGVNGRFDAQPLAASLPSRCGAMVTIDHVAQTAAEKRGLRKSGAIAVDMEAAAVAERAMALDIPFHCVKAVTDLAGEDMANDLNAALRPDGHFDTMRILGSISGRPLARAAELLRLRKRSARAACALGDFFADCSF